MKQGIYRVIENRKLTDTVYMMTLEGDTSEFKKPGQFANIKIDGMFLRRPISIFDWDEKSFSIVYKVVGKGTQTMKEMSIGQELDILSGLGNGFDISYAGDNPVLIGGGVGLPPMYSLAKALLQNNNNLNIKVILGFNSETEMFLVEEFKRLGIDVIVTTVDGSYGKKGFVTDALKEMEYSYFYTCGPTAMLKAIEEIATSSGQYSFEERMGCGFGACMGCSCKTKYGNKRICKDGPVLFREEIIW